MEGEITALFTLCFVRSIHLRKEDEMLKVTCPFPGCRKTVEIDFLNECAVKHGIVVMYPLHVYVVAPWIEHLIREHNYLPDDHFCDDILYGQVTGTCIPNRPEADPIPVGFIGNGELFLHGKLPQKFLDQLTMVLRLSFEYRYASAIPYKQPVYR
jgi:hypothetical protein